MAQSGKKIEIAPINKAKNGISGHIYGVKNGISRQKYRQKYGISGFSLGWMRKISPIQIDKTTL